MKKLFLLIYPLASLTIMAQQEMPDPGNKIIPDKYFEIIIVVLVAWLAISFIMKFVKTLLDNRIKYQMIEKGVSEEMIEKVLLLDKSEAKQMAFKWFLLLVGIAVGLFFMSVFPKSIFSVGIVLLTTALSYLAYYNYLKKNSNK